MTSLEEEVSSLVEEDRSPSLDDDISVLLDVSTLLDEPGVLLLDRISSVVVGEDATVLVDSPVDESVLENRVRLSVEESLLVLLESVSSVLLDEGASSVDDRSCVDVSDKDSVLLSVVVSDMLTDSEVVVKA